MAGMCARLRPLSAGIVPSRICANTNPRRQIRRRSPGWAPGRKPSHAESAVRDISASRFARFMQATLPERLGHRMPRDVRNETHPEGGFAAVVDDVGAQYLGARPEAPDNRRGHFCAKTGTLMRVKIWLYQLQFHQQQVTCLASEHIHTAVKRCGVQHQYNRLC